MARVTVEDCVVKIPNRFELVLLAGQRARDLSAGAAETVERENDKNPVIALREIADETIDLEELHDALIFGLQKYVEVDEPEDDSMAIFAAAEKEWAGVTRDSPVANDAVANDAVADDAVADDAVADDAVADDDTAAGDATTDDTAGDGGGEAPIGVVPGEDAMDAADAAADEASIGETLSEDTIDAANDSGETDTPVVVDETI